MSKTLTLLGLALTLCSGTGGCVKGPTTSSHACVEKVFLTGNESAIIDSVVETSQNEQTPDFPNSLDHAFSVLISRAYPQPKSRDLVEGALASLCEEFQRQTQAKIPSKQQEEWIFNVLQTTSFDRPLSYIEARGSGDLNWDHLIEAGLRGMVKSTGSAWLLTGADADRIKRIVKTREAGKEPGFLGLKLDSWPLIEVITDSPAAEAGLQSGDRIVRVNGTGTTRTKTLAEALKLFAGSSGKTVKMVVKRGKQTLTFEAKKISRAALMIRSQVIEPDILYIKIHTFEGSGVGHKVKQLIHRLLVESVSVVILDVRDNEGGRPEEVNEVADIFLDDKVLQIMEFRSDKRIVFRSHRGAVRASVILLTNRNTASGGEALAMTLRDNHNGTIVGEHTAGMLFGKDFEELGNGQLLAFRSKPTVLSPTGQDYTETGVPPDILVPDTGRSGEDPVLGRAIEIGRNQIGNRATERTH